MNLQEKCDYLWGLLPGGAPVGLTFETHQNCYYYDTSTGKILKCNPLEYQIINLLLKNTRPLTLPPDYSESEAAIAVDNIINAIKTQDILRLSSFETMYTGGL